jgi:hypothetical protein
LAPTLLLEVLEKKQFRCGEGTAAPWTIATPSTATISFCPLEASEFAEAVACRYQLTTSTRKVRAHAGKSTQAAIVNHNQFAHKANNEKTAP